MPEDICDWCTITCLHVFLNRSIGKVSFAVLQSSVPRPKIFCFCAYNIWVMNSLEQCFSTFFDLWPLSLFVEQFGDPHADVNEC
jgi:hypothetical protein